MVLEICLKSWENAASSPEAPLHGRPRLHRSASAPSSSRCGSISILPLTLRGSLSILRGANRVVSASRNGVCRRVGPLFFSRRL